MKVGRFEFDRVDLLRFVAAGSVDDGKSTLIGRLLHDSQALLEDQLRAVEQASRKRGAAAPDLSLLTDGLLAEREQGITIDVAYRHFATARRRFIIADAPGHEQYTRNMATAASTASLAVILIDARKGPTGQTRRHACIASLLGIPRVIAAVNKMDLVGYARDAFETVRDSFTQGAAALAFREIACVPLSALEGDMVVKRGDRMPWYEGPTLLELLENVAVDDVYRRADFRFPVQWVCRPGIPDHHDFRAYAGRIESGAVGVGERIAVLPSGRTSTIRRILTFDGELSRAAAPQSVMLLLEDELDVSRGDMIVKAGADVRVASVCEADLCWLAERPLDLRRQYLVKHTTQTVKIAVTGVRYRIDLGSLRPTDAAAQLRMNDIGRVAIRAQRPLVLDRYARNRSTGSFIVIDPISNETVGAGMVA
ncbi:MAG TPA: GTP-binding protein [candidate division Zixibacteria bacterium]|nr:GTP-binding protein [candidate division Zixibacteria bacterium]